MRALVVGDGAAVADRPPPENAGECRIQVGLAGICGTDLEILKGYAGFQGIPGHEFVGVVESTPDGDRHWIGKRVVGEINAACGACDWCRQGLKTHCPTRSVLGIVDRGGAFASMLSLPADNLHEVPASLSDETAVFVEPTAAACEILTQVAIGGSATVAVVGDGRLGLLIGQVLAATGATVTMIGKHPRKLELARTFGLDARISSNELPPASFDITVDVTGRPEGLTRAMALVRPHGTVVMKSTFHGETPVTLWPAVVNEITLVGSRCGPFDTAIELLEKGVVRTAPLVTGSYALDDFEAGFDAARTGLKVFLRP